MTKSPRHAIFIFCALVYFLAPAYPSRAEEPPPTPSLKWPPAAPLDEQGSVDPLPVSPQQSAPGGSQPQGLPGTWRWRRAGFPEYLGTGMAVVGAGYMEFGRKDPETPKWAARNDFDETVRHLLRLPGASDRQHMHTAGDLLMGVMIAAPVLDSAATLGYRDRNWDALQETMVINLESFAVTSLVAVLLQIFTARERPFARNCVAGTCEFQEVNRSMPSGHAAYAFTGAGLLCSHHHYQSLYGNLDADRSVCTAGMAVASAEGVLRIMSDGHYATDVLAGTALGLFSGLLLPRLLHYSHPVGGEKPHAEEKHRRLDVGPSLLPGGAALTCRYYF